MYGVDLTTGLSRAAEAGLEVVPHAFCKVTTAELLTQRLTLRKTNGPYNIDGLVVAPSRFKMVYESDDKPKGITAFKVNDEAGASITMVEKVIWQVTGRGRIIPKIRIKPTRMDGVTVTNATAHNAKWMIDRRIGPGAKVKVLRSGGVIPKIVSVIKAGKFQAPNVPYVQRGVHFYAVDQSDETAERVDVLNIVKFMKTFGIELLAAKTAHKVFDRIDSPLEYVRLWHSRRLQTRLVEAGVGEKMAVKIVAEFDKAFSMKVMPMRQLMVATQCFDAGIGDRKLQMIEAHGISMNTLTITAAKPLAEQLMEVRGYSEKSTALTIKGIKPFLKVLQEFKKHILIDGTLPAKPKKVVKGKLSGQLISFTGYRDKLHEAAVIKAGGELVPFGSRTTLLLHKAGGKDSTKVEKARAKGIKVAYFNELKVTP
jgi:NAD-dependent DNA ligase